MKPDLNKNNQDNLAHVDTTQVNTQDSLGLASENMVCSPVSVQFPLSENRSTESEISDVMCNLPFTDNEISNLDNFSTIYEEVQNRTSFTSDISLTVSECPSFTVDRTVDKPHEATVNDNLATVNDNLDTHLDLLELSTILCDKDLINDESMSI